MGRSGDLGDFTEQADDYVRTRPPYAPALVERLAARLAESALVVDIGAGTGIFSQQLVRAAPSVRVIAVEPNAAMRARAIPHDRIRWVDGTFEQTGLTDASVDAAFAAQALHWADLSRALPEVRRVLRLGGWLCALWNDRANARSPVLQAVHEVIGAEVPAYDFGYRDRDWGEALGAAFPRVSCEEVAHVVPMPRARFLALWRSSSRLSTLAGPGRLQRIIDAVSADLDARGLSAVEVPYVTRAWTGATDA